jgi:hypothetical protein
MPSAASVATPNTYTQDATYAGWRSGSSLPGGSTRSAPRRTRAVHIRASASSPLDAGSTGSGAAPGSGSALDAVLWRRPGKGARSAMPKIATITAISTRFASAIVKIDQVRYLPGALRSTATAPWTAREGFIADSR